VPRPRVVGTLTYGEEFGKKEAATPRRRKKTCCEGLQRRDQLKNNRQKASFRKWAEGREDSEESAIQPSREGMWERGSRLNKSSFGCEKVGVSIIYGGIMRSTPSGEGSPGRGVTAAKRINRRKHKSQNE